MQVKTIDPETGKPASRETNTMPQWAGSCWYTPSTHNHPIKVIFSEKSVHVIV